MTRAGETMPEISTFEDARAAVAGGTAPTVAARALMAHMTRDEMLRCLDGDVPAHAVWPSRWTADTTAAPHQRHASTGSASLVLRDACRSACPSTNHICRLRPGRDELSLRPVARLGAPGQNRRDTRVPVGFGLSYAEFRSRMSGGQVVELSL